MANNALGEGALASNVNGNNNNAMDDLALENATGSYNTALGAEAGFDDDTGSNNIYIGHNGGPGENHVIAIGTRPPVGIPYDHTYIGGIYNSAVTDRIVYVSSTGRLGTLASSRRYEEEIKPMYKTSEG